MLLFKPNMIAVFNWLWYFFFYGWLWVNNDGFIFSLGLDWYNYIFLGMLLICGLMSLNYSLHYMGYNNYSGNSLYINMFAFLSIMILLSLSKNLLTGLLFWEYLGIVSFFLIVYYQNYYGLTAPLITLIVSRIGDVLFFLLVGLYVFVYDGLNNGFIVSLFLVFFIVGSKSAMFPISSWLLEAMRAPTPVSALVHSSTLVAAGVWFMCSYYWYLSSYINSLFLFSSCIATIVVTGVCACLMADSKKIVALSTSNNISWCILYMVSGCSSLALLQLLVHGLGKCFFFILMGNNMSSNQSAQNYVIFYNNSSIFGAGINLISVFCLAGVPFMGIYFSKHFFFSFLYGDISNILVGLLLLIGYLLTNIYSVRLFMLHFGSKGGLDYSYDFVFLLMVYLIPFIGLVCVYSVDSLTESVEGSHILSYLLMIILIIGGFLGSYVYNHSVYTQILHGYGTSFGYMDLLIVSFLSVYRSLLAISSVGLYRWDYDVVNNFYSMFINNYLVLSGFSCLVILCFLI
uniref:NADH:ubiquinone reductase (H(+)-translocating) n=1 Tax=Polylabroides guangdongensis TaxID=1131911 RepID=A0A3G0WMG8_9PLAT|nr:NADH dehydrogenase subunit 5 [Polylabroides guangdongensis]